MARSEQLGGDHANSSLRDRKPDFVPILLLFPSSFNRPVWGWDCPFRPIQTGRTWCENELLKAWFDGSYAQDLA